MVRHHVAVRGTEGLTINTRGTLPTQYIGLVISQRFCQMMGGDITVASEPGKGSVFTVRLPSGAES